MNPCAACYLGNLGYRIESVPWSARKHVFRISVPECPIRISRLSRLAGRTEAVRKILFPRHVQGLHNRGKLCVQGQSAVRLVSRPKMLAIAAYEVAIFWKGYWGCVSNSVV